MKNIDPLITAAELGAVQIPRFRFTLEDSLIRFSTKSSGLSSELFNTSIPLTVETLSSSQNHAWAAFSINGFSRIKYLRIDTVADWNLSNVGATTVQATSQCQRLGLFNDGANVYLYYPDINTVNDFFQIKRVSLTTQTSNPVSIASATNYGPQVPFVYEYIDSAPSQSSEYHFNAIRAIMPVASGLIVMTGDHNYEKQKIFFTFYYVNASGYRKLATTFTGDIDQPLSTTSDAPMYSQACAYEEGGVIYVYFNTNQNERTAYFTINNGIESEIGLVIPIDKEDTDQNFACSSISKINNIYLLTGRLTFKNSDDTTVGFDTYLTSSDLKNWSVGEFNSFISTNDAKGKIVYSNNYLYYLGNLYWARAVPNREIAPAATTIPSYDITDRVTRFTLSQTLNEADSFSFNLNNQDSYFNSGGPSSSSTLYAEAGQGNVLSQIGIYSVDAKDQAYSAEGIQLREVSGRDIAIKKLNDWQSPIDMWLEGATQFRSDMTVSDGLIVKSEDIDKFGSFTAGSNFKFTGLNTPYMMLFDAPYSESSIIKTSVYITDYDDPYHLSSVGFMLGAYEDEDKNFNSLMLLVPRERGGATPYTTKSTLRKLNLTTIDTSDPEKVNTGLKYEQFISSLWRQNADEIPITTSTAATYEHVSDFRIPKATQTDLMVRLNGREIQLYSKERVRSGAGWAQGAEWLLKTVVQTPETENLYPQQNSYAGLVVSTDVSASKDWFAQGKYGDMVVQLSVADSYDTPGSQGPWIRNLQCDQGEACNHSGNRAGSTLTSYIIEGLENLEHLAVGMKIMIHGVSYFTGWYITTIEEIYAGEGRIRIALNMPPGYLQYTSGSQWTPDSGGAYQQPEDYNYNVPGGFQPPAQSGTWSPLYSYQTIYNYEIQIFGLGNQTHFAEVSSQSKPVEINNSSTYVNAETGATKKAILLEGRGALVTSDSTAMSIRHFDSDGIFHRLKSGNTETGGSYTPFDVTSPTVNTSKWKFIMYHGKFFDGTPNSLGCKTNGYVIVEDEVIRYIEYASLQRGRYPGDTPVYNTVTICPSAYAPVQDASLGTSYVYNWKSWGGSTPGDQFDDLATTFGVSPVGMLVEVLSKNVSNDNTSDGDSNYYVQSIVGSTNSTTAGIQLSTPLRTRLKGPITNIDNPSDPYWSVTANKNQAPEGDMVVVSGRAQFNTKKGKHSETSAVRYYPCNSNGESPYIKISSTEYYHGGVVTTEDIVRKIAAMAGVRNIKARTAFDDAAATDSLSYTLTSTAQSLPLQENMEDFTLEGDFYIPGNNITSGAVSGRNELRIYFRNQYYIAIEQYVTAADYDAGYKGTLYIRLATTSGLINAFNSEKTVEGIKIRNIDNFSGTYSGTSPVSNATLTPNLSKKTKVKISVDKKFISVEINGKRAISFCIEEYVLTGGATLAVYGSGPIQLSYKANIAGNSNSVRVYGVGDPMSGYALRQDTSAKSAISEILDARHVFMRSTEVGGIEFGQFWNRDYFGELHTFIVNDQDQQSSEQIIGHITYKSDKIVTNWIDEDWVIQNGYKYLSGSGATVENSYYALREAKLMLRKQKEKAFTREIEALPRLALQPEDEVSIAHDNLPSGVYIIDSITLNVEDSSSVNASYSVRKKVI
jgi:hypothetical protein